MAGEFDWYKVKFLESAANIKGVLTQSVGREPSTQIAKHAALCLQQGRMFFEAAARAPLEIRPLLIFYGILGFSKAVIVARNFSKLETLDQTHGLNDTSAQNAKLEQLQVKILDRGTFQLFNDTICKLDRVQFFKRSMPTSISIPTSKSDLLSQKTITLKEILSRIPGVEVLYRDTFNEDAKAILCTLHYLEQYDGFMELRIDDPEIFGNRDTLRAMVDKWRKRFPFLQNWCLVRAEPAWGNSVLIFGNVDKGTVDEFSEEFLRETKAGFISEDVIRAQKYKRRNLSEILDPLAGGLGGFPYMIESLDGVHTSEFSLHYLGMFLLSSLVRYRPQVWGHAISRLTTSESPADDKALALIEKFMDISLAVFPRGIVEAISVH